MRNKWQRDCLQNVPRQRHTKLNGNILLARGGVHCLEPFFGRTQITIQRAHFFVCVCQKVLKVSGHAQPVSCSLENMLEETRIDRSTDACRLVDNPLPWWIWIWLWQTRCSALEILIVRLKPA